LLVRSSAEAKMPPMLQASATQMRRRSCSSSPMPCARHSSCAVTASEQSSAYATATASNARTSPRAPRITRRRRKRPAPLPLRRGIAGRSWPLGRPCPESSCSCERCTCRSPLRLRARFSPVATSENAGCSLPSRRSAASVSSTRSWAMADPLCRVSSSSPSSSRPPAAAARAFVA